MAKGIVVHPSIPFGIGSDKFPGFSKLIEEQGETLLECGKIMGAQSLDEHWDDKGTLKQRLEDEIADTRAAQRFVASKNGLDWDAITKREAKKLRKFHRWHDNIQAGRDPNDDG